MARFSAAVVMAAVMIAGQAAAADSPEQIARGRYLVENVGMCNDCHTPRGSRGEPDRTRSLAGAPIDFRPTVPVRVWVSSAPAIAGPKALGWSREQMVAFLSTGTTPDGRGSLPPMPMLRLNQDDAEAVAAYLASVPLPPR
ncbi:MAG: c-type cytochrome [Rhodospirillaceae bacterium]|nr:c-type cytochrome [Rhodospirillales bacterium]